MKDKKKITAVLVAIAGALRKGFDLLNENGQHPAATDDDLAVMGPHIVKGLRAALNTIEENARFEGLSYEEILEKKEAEKQEGIRKNLEAAGEALKALRAVPEPVELDDDESLDGAQDDSDLDESAQGDSDQDPDNGEGDEDPDDESGDDEPDDQLLYGYSMSELETMKTELEAELKRLDIKVPEFEVAAGKLATVNNFIEKLKSQLKAQE